MRRGEARRESAKASVVRTGVADNENLEAVVAAGALCHGNVCNREVGAHLEAANVIVALSLDVRAAKDEELVSHGRGAAVANGRGQARLDCVDQRGGEGGRVDEDDVVEKMLAAALAAKDGNGRGPDDAGAVAAARKGREALEGGV